MHIMLSRRLGEGQGERLQCPDRSASSARAAWTRDIPGLIASDMLGIHASTATPWANRGRRGWTDYYTSARAEAQAGRSRPALMGRILHVPVRLCHQ
jgi:hypothetical protein